MGSTKSLHESEIVISFFSILQLMVKSPDARRMINWRIKFFNKEAASIDRHSPVYNASLRMVEELALCQRRKRSRRYMFNMASIDQVNDQYLISRSPFTLGAAWSLFDTGRYRTEE